MLATHTQAQISVSPMLLADRMLTLAQEAERAGLANTAGRLVLLAHTVFDEPAATPLQLPSARAPRGRSRSKAVRMDAAICV